MSKTYLTFIVLVFCISFSTNAQYLMDDVKKPDKPKVEGNRWVFGGDFGLMFGSYTYINISPLAGYKLTNKLTAGAGITYLYLKQETEYPGSVATYTYSSNIYGGKLFASYALLSGLEESIGFALKDIFVYSEYEPLNVDRYELTNIGFEKAGRIWAHGILVGGGVSLPMGARSAIRLMYLYNLNESINSPYQNPILRVNLIF